MSSERQSAGIKGAGGKGIGGQFKAHEASEPGFSLEGLTRHPSERNPAAARRSRKQAAAAKSLTEAYPDVVAARFVDIGSRDLVGPNGTRWPNPDYVDQSDVPYFARKSFELRDVLLADGTVADENNQPRFTEDPSVEQLADTFTEHAAAVFDAEPDPYAHEPYVEALFKDHVNNQHTWFHQLINDAAPRELAVDKWGDYVDTVSGQTVTDPTDLEKADLGGRTPQVALQEHADELIKANGRKGTLRRLSQEIASGPERSRQLGELWLTVNDSKDRSLLRRMFRR